MGEAGETSIAVSSEEKDIRVWSWMFRSICVFYLYAYMYRYLGIHTHICAELVLRAEGQISSVKP